MGFQSQEQSTFDGLYTTSVGATAPRWSAMDEVNIDHQARSIRGRDPSFRVSTVELPQLGYRCDGDISTVMLQSVPTTAMAAGTFTFRIYVGRVDTKFMAAHSVGTRFCLVNASRNSTTDITTPLSGFNIYFEVVTSNRLDLRASYDYGTSTDILSLANVAATGGILDDVDKHVCVEFARSGSAYSFSLYSDATTQEDTDAFGNTALDTTGMGRIVIGAFSVSDGTGDYSLYAPFTCGGVQVLNTFATVGSPHDRFQSFDRSDLPTYVEYMWCPEYVNSYVDVSATQASDEIHDVVLQPIPPGFVSDNVLIYRGSYGRLNLSGLSTDSSNGWMAIIEHKILNQILSSSAPPWLATAGTDIVISVAETTATTYTLTVAIGTYDSNGDPQAVASSTTGNLNYADTNKIGMLVVPDFGARQITLTLYAKAGAGAWAAAGTPSTVNGLPISSHEWHFGTNETQARWLDHHLHSFRLFNGFSTPPANAAAVIALDSYPTDGGGVTQWPSNLVTSFDATATSVSTVSTGPVQIRDRATHWRGDFNKGHIIEFLPRFGGNNWSCFQGLSRGHRPPVYGVNPVTESLGGDVRRYLNYVLPGGVYRFDETAGSGSFLPLSGAAGYPTSGVIETESKDRQILSGSGFAPMKVYPGGVSGVGLPAPELVVTAVSSIGTGALATSTTYYYRFTIYNTLTGQESNPTIHYKFTTSVTAGTDTLTLSIDSFTLRGSYEDWDAIRMYRQVPDEGLNEFYLEAEVPRPQTLPPDPVLEIKSSAADADLVLQRIVEYDNHTPPHFEAAALPSRTLYIGVGGNVQYSKPNFIESFPPTNLFLLDDDQSNEVMAIVAIFGRVIIIKRRGIWGGQDNISDTGQDPAKLHDDRGLASKRGWAVADNVIFFLSPDRAVYLTDGVELQDVSTKLIKQTLLGYSDSQISGCQAVHDARSKSVWFLFPKGPNQKGANREVLVYRYDDNRWQKYEMACDSISTGHDESDAGEFGGFGYRGAFYRLRQGDTNQESDAGSGQSVFVYDYDDNDANEAILKTSGGYVTGVSSLAMTWDPTVEGMPCIIVPHDTAFNPAAPQDYHPLWDEGEDARIYNYVRGTRVSGSTEFLYFGERFTTTARFLWVGVGVQYRRYASQWVTPQGEDRPHMFFGCTFVHHPDHAVADTDPYFKYVVDYESEASGGWRTKSAAPKFPDTSHKFHRRTRRFRFLIAESERGGKFEITRVCWRYRVRGPRSKR